MDPRPWYKKKRYIVPAGILGGFYFIALASGPGIPTVPANTAAVEQASVPAAQPAAQSAASAPVQKTVTPAPTAAVKARVQTQPASDPAPAAATQAAPVQQSAPAPAAAAQAAPAQQSAPADSGLSNDNYYTNVDGNAVRSPAYTPDNSVPADASAQCRDGTYSFSQHRSGTCSHHGGVAQWL